MTPSDRYDSLFEFYAERYSVHWDKLKAQARAESALKPDVISSAGAMGLLQFMRPTFNEWATKLAINRPDPFNPEHSIWCGAAYMQWLLSRCSGDYREAWSCYNWGLGNVHKAQIADPINWFANAPKETRDYVERIESYLV